MAHDFPTGRRRKHNLEQHINHPKLLQLKQLVEEHAADYHAADKATERTTLEGQFLRSKSNIIMSIMNEVKPEGPDGRYKKSVMVPGTDVVTWVVNEAFNDAKLHKKVTNDLNEQIKAITAAVYSGASDAPIEQIGSEDPTNPSEQGDNAGNESARRSRSVD